MCRPQGFLLCVPEGFLTPEVLEQGQQASAAEGIGPSLSIEAAPVADRGGRMGTSPLTRAGYGGGGGLGRASFCRLGPGLGGPELVHLADGSPSVFPLAAEVVRQGF